MGQTPIFARCVKVMVGWNGDKRTVEDYNDALVIFPRWDLVAKGGDAADEDGVRIVALSRQANLIMRACWLRMVNQQARREWLCQRYACGNFEFYLNPGGTYVPTIRYEPSEWLRKLFADEYDRAQEERGDSRRAWRGTRNMAHR
jgi:hypothetical protein